MISLSEAVEFWYSADSTFSSSGVSSLKLLTVHKSVSSGLELSESVRNLGSAPFNEAPILLLLFRFSLLIIILFRQAFINELHIMYSIERAVSANSF